MKVIFLGTNGWYDTDTGNTPSVLIVTKKEYVIFDAGTGIYKIDRYISSSSKPIHLFLSHFHLDHIIGLHALAKFNFRQGINIYGPPGLDKCANTILNKPYSARINYLKTKLTIKELLPRTKITLKMKWAPLKHSTLCFGYRLSADNNKTIAYCTDTGLCPNLVRLSEGADLLITECSFKSGQEEKTWPHLNPEQAALSAAEAGAKRLALIHFDASIYSSLREREKSAMIAKKIFKNVFAAKDGDVVTV